MIYVPPAQPIGIPINEPRRNGPNPSQSVGFAPEIPNANNPPPKPNSVPTPKAPPNSAAIITAVALRGTDSAGKDSKRDSDLMSSG